MEGKESSESPVPLFPGQPVARGLVRFVRAEGSSGQKVRASEQAMGRIRSDSGDGK